MEPIWRLDRRDSGHLFWRRDSGSPAAPDRARVKFRCDVEVLEFWPREDDPSSDDDCGDDDDEEEERRLKEWRRRRSAPVAASNPAVVVAICLAAVVVTVSLPWLLVR